MDSQPAAVEATSVLSSLSPSDSNPQDIITTYHTRSSHLDSIQALLSNGERQKAIQVAVEQRMWPHALIIANSLGSDVWRETVKEFVRFEMGDGDLSSLGPGHLGSAPSSPAAKGREGLRTLYTLFAGAGPAAGMHLTCPVSSLKLELMELVLQSMSSLLPVHIDPHLILSHMPCLPCLPAWEPVSWVLPGPLPPRPYSNQSDLPMQRYQTMSSTNGAQWWR
jgi:hypothetical protein